MVKCLPFCRQSTLKLGRWAIRGFGQHRINSVLEKLQHQLYALRSEASWDLSQIVDTVWRTQLKPECVNTEETVIAQWERVPEPVYLADRLDHINSFLQQSKAEQAWHGKKWAAWEATDRLKDIERQGDR
jgi:hypothetical protein